MTKTLTLRALDIPSLASFHKFGIGFDSVFDELSRTTEQQSSNAYPPYNIIKYDEDHFSIELAVAGFSEGEISIQVEKNQLTITGEQKNITPTVEYVVHGISSRPFKRTFTLAEHVVVIGAGITDGLLKVGLERQVPEEQKPRSIQINYTK